MIVKKKYLLKIEKFTIYCKEKNEKIFVEND